MHLQSTPLAGEGRVLVMLVLCWSCRGGGGPGLWGLGGVSDVAGMQGLGGVLTVWVSPSRGLPGSLWTLLTHVESLTSHFDREEGFAWASWVLGHLTAIHCS